MVALVPDAAAGSNEESVSHEKAEPHDGDHRVEGTEGSPVRAGMLARLVEVDKDARVAECAPAAVARGDAALDEADGLVLDELDGGEWPGLERLVGLLEAGTDHGFGAAWRGCAGCGQDWVGEGGAVGGKGEDGPGGLRL